MNEFRRDPITRRWVIISANRDARPNQFAAKSSGVSTAPSKPRATKNCPFCAGQMDTPPMVATYGQTSKPPTRPNSNDDNTASNNDTWQVCVVPNLYPVVNGLGSFSLPAAGELFARATGMGVHDVVIESPTHATQAGELTDTQFRCMLQAYRDRIRWLGDQSGIAYAQVMKNSGADAGASLEHSHSQIFGLPFVPEQVANEVNGAHRYWDAAKQCVFCDLIAAERAQETRVVAENEDFVAWCPYASRFGFETWIAPRRHAARFEDSSDQLLDRLASLFHTILRHIEQHGRIAAYNYLIHTLPFDTGSDQHYHWHIEIIPRIAKAAGFEWGTGVHINTIDPDRAARELRAVPDTA